MKYVAPDFITGDFPPFDVSAPKPDRQAARLFQFLDCASDLRARRLIGRWPNWEAPLSYFYIDELGLKALGWEFLRRNPLYIADYHAWKILHSQANAGPQTESPCTWEDVGAASVAIAQRYGLHVERYPPCPSLDTPPLLDGESAKGVADVLMVGESNDAPPSIYAQPPGKGLFTVLCIYPDRSEDTQIETLRHYLRELRELTGKTTLKSKSCPRPESMKIYLQILDAKAAWAENPEIIQATYASSRKTTLAMRETPLSKQLSKDYKQARELALTGYRKLFTASIHEKTS